MTAKLAFCVFFFISTLSLHSQNENSKWYFGNTAGLDFMTSPPSYISTSQMSGPEGSSSIANAAGVLQFYTNGVDVYNAQNVIMANGSPPLQGGNNKQGTLIVKQPGNSSLYYIFVASYTGFRYSIVDMSLAAGSGSIIVKNATLTTINQAYKVAGTRHCNGTDVWIVTQDDNSSTSRAYLLTALGLTAPVLSSTGAANTVYAALKFSPDGTKLASTEWGDGVRLYDFNNATGTISNLQVIDGQGFAAWGLEFSPDGSKLYATRGSFFLFQWDLTAGSPAAIAASQYTVYSSYGPNGPNNIIASLQLAPDGKIYCARDNATSLPVINNPNLAGAACNFNLVGATVQANDCEFGLPNQMKPGIPLPAIGFTVSTVYCSTATFAVVGTTLGGVSSGTSATVSWNFGDPASGLTNVSSLSSPVHPFSAPGTYTVQLLLTSACGTSTVSQTVTVTNPVLPITTSGSNSLCAGNSITLTASGANTYVWYSPLGVIANNPSVAITPTASGIYTVVGTFTNLNCALSRTIDIFADPGPPFTVAGDLSICDKETTTLTASGAGSYSWTSGAISFGTQSSVVLNPAVTTIYTVMGTGPTNSCVSSQVITVTVSLFPAVSLSGNLIVCMGQTVTLTGQGASSYSWMTAAGVAATGSIYTSVPAASQSFTLVGADASGECLTENVYSLLVDACVGISENAVDPAVILFPNPSAGVLTVNLKTESLVEVYDLSGRRIVHSSHTGGKQILDISAQPDGIYILRVITKDVVSVYKVVKHND